MRYFSLLFHILCNAVVINNVVLSAKGTALPYHLEKKKFHFFLKTLLASPSCRKKTTKKLTSDDMEPSFFPTADSAEAKLSYTFPYSSLSCPTVTSCPLNHIPSMSPHVYGNVPNLPCNQTS